MTKYFLLLSFILCFFESKAQSIFDANHLDRYPDIHAQEDFSLIGEDQESRRSTITTPPTSPVRAMAEWEELDAIVISWTGYLDVLSDIVRHAQNECKVYINCRGSDAPVRQYLSSRNVIISENVIFLEQQQFNSIWIRDYGPNSAYINDVDSLVMVDWIYNRSFRPDDDKLPSVLAEYLDVPLYETIEGTHRLTATGGNFMSDGIETGFSSKLIIDENPAIVEDDVDQIMLDFLGIEEYVKFDNLLYDAIHHIDMHMKLLDEERVIFGSYPEGEGDHAIIEANIEYLISQKLNAFGEPYQIERVLMPPDGNNAYPDDPGSPDYRTYTNALFVNKTILVPTYEERYDTIALQKWREAMPGYNIQGIECNDIIQAFGAIHCVTKEIGVQDPLRIVFQQIKDQEEAQSSGYPLIAKIQHRSGIESAILHYREEGSTTYQALQMDVLNKEDNTFQATIPDFISLGTIEYYVEATANSGKNSVRPLPAPEGYYDFEIRELTSTKDNYPTAFMRSAFPNPSSGLVCIPVELNSHVNGELTLLDINGRILESIHAGYFPGGTSKHFINVAKYPAGLYTLRLMGDQKVHTQKLVVK